MAHSRSKRQRKGVVEHPDVDILQTALRRGGGVAAWLGLKKVALNAPLLGNIALDNVVRLSQVRLG